MNEATAVDEIEDVLKQCGAAETTLTPQERYALDRDGYVILPSLVDTSLLEALRTAFEIAWSAQRQATQTRESGTRHIDDLVNRDPIFERVYTHPTILAAVYHVLGGPFRLGQMNGRDPQPGFGQQGLHADWVNRARSEPYRIVTTIWLLDDFTAENGATRLVPGTHLLLTQPPKSFADPASRHRDQKVIVAEAGSVLLFNGHLWHSGTRNKSSKSRRVIQCSFVARSEFRFGRVKVESSSGLSDAAKYFLGID